MLWTAKREGRGIRLVVLRIIGWLLVAAAVVLLGRDLVHWIHDGHWLATPAGKAWYSLSPGSLNLLQAGVERHLWKPLWGAILWILLRPVWLVLVVPGLVLALWPRRRQKRRRRFGRLRG
jgi:hypothetical protein